MNNIIKEIKPFLDEYDSLMFTFLRDVAYVEFGNVDTAQVTFPEGKSVMTVSKEFWDKLVYDEKCFLIAHEIMHVLLDHGVRGKAFFETLPQKDRNHPLLNIAMDVALNELLLNQFFDRDNVKLPFLKDYGCFIQNIFTDKGIDVEIDKNFEYYYHKLLENQESVDDDMSYDHEYLDGLCDEAIEEILEELKEIVKEIEDGGGKGYSENDEINNFENVIRKKEKTQENLEKHIDYMMRVSVKGKRVRYKTDWITQDRRYSGIVRRDVTIPSYRPIKIFEKHKIVVYCDVSGSVESYVSKFVDVLSKVNADKYDLELFVFADRVVKATLTNGKMNYSGAGYGTRFNEVIDHFGKTYGRKQVDGVFVLTDGYYTNITKSKSDTNIPWAFFYVPGSKSNHFQDAKGIFLKV